MPKHLPLDEEALTPEEGKTSDDFAENVHVKDNELMQDANGNHEGQIGSQNHCEEASQYVDGDITFEPLTVDHLKESVEMDDHTQLEHDVGGVSTTSTTTLQSEHSTQSPLPPPYSNQVVLQEKPLYTQQPALHVSPGPQVLRSTPPTITFQPVIMGNPPNSQTRIIQFSRNPMQLVCPYCRYEVETATSLEPGEYLCCMGAFLCLFVGLLCFILWCIPHNYDVNHSCPNCKAKLGTYKAGGGC